MKASLTTSLLELVADPAGRVLMAALDQDQLRECSRTLVRENVYGSNDHLRVALTRLESDPDDSALDAVLEHRLWCAHREARWLTEDLDEASFRDVFELRGLVHLTSTRGPTVIVAPMTLGTHDATACTLTAIANLPQNRPLVLYGEAMDPSASALLSRAPFASHFATRSIVRALRADGFLFTYADFVYEGHPTVPVQMFGIGRPFSHSLARIIASMNTTLLPALAWREDDGCVVEFFEPVRIEPDDTVRLGDELATRVTAQLVARWLEGLIRRRPRQWLLLETLAFDVERSRPQ